MTIRDYIPSTAAQAFQGDVLIAWLDPTYRGCEPRNLIQSRVSGLDGVVHSIGRLLSAPTQPAAQGEPVAREAILAVVRAAWALVDNTGHHDLLPLAINRDDWNDLAARLAALKSLLPDEELPADPPHAVAYFWPARASIDTAGSPAAPAWIKAYEAECQRTGSNFNAQNCIAQNFPQIVTAPALVETDRKGGVDAP